MQTDKFLWNISSLTNQCFPKESFLSEYILSDADLSLTSVFKISRLQLFPPVFLFTSWGYKFPLFQILVSERCIANEGNCLHK